MVAVGVWAAQLGGRATWILPLMFMGVITFAGSLGVAGVPLGPVEAGIAASLVVLGGLVAFKTCLPLAVSAGIVGILALFHGHAHGAEMPVTVSGFTYALGFVLATGLLHGLGLGIGPVLGKAWQDALVRAGGGAIAATGLALMIG
jgi:urease accessory protein